MPANPVNFRFAFRVLLLALDEWVRQDTPPPPSAYGRNDDGALVSIERDEVGWPNPPGLPFPQHPRIPRRLNWGARWSGDGIIDSEPPGLGEIYPTHVSRVDGDGNEVAGIKMPEVAVPLGTFTGWEFRSEEKGATWALVGLSGVFFPFGRTQSEADAAGDPRLPIDERYRVRKDYIGRSVNAGRGLVFQRVMLERELDLVAERAAALYDWAVGR